MVPFPLFRFRSCTLPVLILTSILPALLGTGVTSAHAQETAGVVRGVVRTAEGAPLDAAEVTVESPTLAGSRRAITDDEGRFQVVGLPPGIYAVRIERLGHRSATIEDVPIQVGVVTELDPVHLPIRPVELEPLPLVMEGPEMIVDPVSTAAGMNVHRDVFSKLPVERDYNSLLTLVPQVSTTYLEDGVNVAGSTGTESVYFINGVNVTDPLSASGGISLPYNFVEEVRVTEGGYQAEHGRSLGALVDVVTRRGGESLELEVFGNFFHDRLATEARAGPGGFQTSGFSDYDVGVSVGGPIGSTARFFAAYNGRFQNSDVAVPGFLDQIERRTTHMFAGRLDWRVAPETDLLLNVVGDPTTEEWVGHRWEGLFPPETLDTTDPFLALTRTGGISAALQAHTTRWDDVLLEGGLAFYRRSDGVEGRTERGRSEPLYVEAPTGYWEGGFGHNRDNRVTRWSADVEGTWLLDDHTVKVGLAYEENVADIDRFHTEPGSYIDFGPFVWLLTNDARARVRNRVPSVFLQDSWQLNERVTLNLGLRWNGQFFYGTGDTLAQAIPDQFQPRVGIVVRPDEGDAKLFASGGRYYQQLPLALSSAQHILFENRVITYPSDPRDGTVEPISDVEFGAVEAPLSPRVDGIEGQHYNEFIVGFETRALGDTRFLVRGIRRLLRQTYVIGWDTETGEFRAGNPGSGALDFLPEPERKYTGMELTAERMRRRGLGWMVSYTYSRVRGNYAGFFSAADNVNRPANSFGLQVADQAPTASGKLPTDRPHLFKLFGSYGMGGWTVGGFFLVQSGTPLNEFAPSSLPGRPRYLVPRGTAGRTPTLWDLSLRVTYDLDAVPVPGLSGGGVRLLADLLHVGSPREVVQVNQWRYVGGQDDFIPNPAFRQPLVYQPPMMLRLGFEWNM